MSTRNPTRGARFGRPNSVHPGKPNQARTPSPTRVSRVGGSLHSDGVRMVTVMSNTVNSSREPAAIADSVRRVALYVERAYGGIRSSESVAHAIRFDIGRALHRRPDGVTVAAVAEALDKIDSSIGLSKGTLSQWSTIARLYIERVKDDDGNTMSVKAMSEALAQAGAGMAALYSHRKQAEVDASAAFRAALSGRLKGRASGLVNIRVTPAVKEAFNKAAGRAEHSRISDDAAMRHILTELDRLAVKVTALEQAAKAATPARKPTPRRKAAKATAAKA